MRQKTGRVRSAAITGAAALGIVLGSVGVGWAVSPSPTPPSTPVAQVSQATSGQAVSQATSGQAESQATSGTEAVEVNETAEAVEAPEAAGTPEAVEADGGAEVQDPSYATSITAPQDEGLSEADEAKSLESLATISPDQARDAALAVVPGTAGKVELDNENGAVVYSVEITDGSGSQIDVKVDAGNATVVYQGVNDGDHEG